ncbi:MAG: carboxypeptidase regulatory-like domain-containing protein, partial [Tannerella sp.]|nr:carboxypeptidase regulatory-like domain-containing protein [Tannerella sp.]
MAALLCTCTKDEKEVEQLGSIYGVITDKATGELIRSADVQLNSLGAITTGDDGRYEFNDLKAGEYTLQVTKTGYDTKRSLKIAVKAGQKLKYDVQLEKLPASLRIVDDDKKDINELDFGMAAADLTRSFHIFNDGPESLEWQITKTAKWITTISKPEGVLQSGKTQSIVIAIDRELLAGGENQTTIHITSDNGGKELKVKAASEKKTL